MKTMGSLYRERLDTMWSEVRIRNMADGDQGYFTSNPNQLQEFGDTVRQFFRRFGIGAKLSKAKWGDERAAKIQKLLYQTMDAKAVGPTETPADVMARLNATITDPHNKYSKDDFARVARTEVAAMRAGYQLMTAQQLGYTHVRHLTRRDIRVSRMCKAHAGKVYLIRQLLENDKDRIPLHPNCRCKYELARR